MEGFGTQELENELYSQGAPIYSDAELLKHAVLNEKSAPEILQYEEDLITRIESHLDYQEAQLELMSDKPELEILRAIFSTELARIRFLLRSYLRTRLLKIEQHVMYILDNTEFKDRLSPKEDSYAQEYFILLGGHFKGAIANHLPDAFASIVKQASAHPNKDMVPTPNFNKHVFCRVMTDQGAIPVDEQGNTAEFNKDDLFVIRYDPIQRMVQTGAVQLM